MKPLLVPIVFFVSIIIVAHFFAPSGYIWTRNTISELASQGYSNKWIMQLGFIGYGILLAGGLIWRSLSTERLIYHDSPILLYGLSILVTGIFCAAPIDGSNDFSVREDQIHTVFATVAGISLVLAILWHMFVSSENQWHHLAFLILITGLSLLFGLAKSSSIPVGQGFIQRMLYAASFIWLLII